MVTIVGADGSGDRTAARARADSSAWTPTTRADAPADLGLVRGDRPALQRAVPSGCARTRDRRRPSGTGSERHDGELRWIEMIATEPPRRRRGARHRHQLPRHHRSGRGRAERAGSPRSECARCSRTSPTSISVIDADGSLRYSSPTVERVYGYKEGEWPEGQQHLRHRASRRPRTASSSCGTGSLSTPGEFRPLEIRLRKGDGSWMYTEIIANNLLDDPSVERDRRHVARHHAAQGIGRGAARERGPAARERVAVPRHRRRSDRVGVPLPPRRDAHVHEPGVRRVLRIDERRARGRRSSSTCAPRRSGCGRSSG